MYFTALVYNLFVQCSFLPNHKKSVLVPTQRLVTLGFVLDSCTMLISIGRDKSENIVKLCVDLIHVPRCSIHHLAKVIGKMISILPALPISQMHYY